MNDKTPILTIKCPHCGYEANIKILSLWSNKYIQEFIAKSRVILKPSKINKKEK